MRRRFAVVAVVALAASSLARADHARAEIAFDLDRPVRGNVVRHFEPPPTPFAAGHRGIDLAVPEGTPVRAAAAGLVAFAGQVGGELFVSIDHEGGYRTTYSYLSRVLVRAGAAVAQGEPVALSGPGHADGEPLLHFGLRRADRYLDPEPWLIEGMRRNLWRVIRLAA